MTQFAAKKALLLVEDNPADADLVQEFLERAGGEQFRILLASRVEQALQRLRENKVDVVLLDLRLPDGSGIETVKAVLSEADQTPVIVLTGTDDEELAISCIDAGADDFLHKSEIQPNLLRRSIGYSITRRREIQSKQQQVQRLVSSSPDAVVVTDAHGAVRFANEAAIGLFGRKRGNFVGDRFPFEVRDGQVREIEVVRQGNKRLAEMRVARIEWEGAEAYLASIRDNTEQRQLEEKFRQSQKMEAIGRLAGGVAHDFNNLLTVILGSAEMLLEQTPANDPAAALARDIMTAGDRAAALTRQLLAFSRRSAADMVPVNVNQLVAEMERLLRRVIGEDVVLETRLEKNPHLVRADPTDIGQAIMNMAINARDAMPAGGTITISTENARITADSEAARKGAVPGDCLCLSVADTGVGMDEDVKASIFEPFFTTKEPGKGTGLGLATVYAFACNCGGHVSAESAPGKGAKFTISLPALVAQPRERTPVPSTPEAFRASGTILVAEDEEIVREVTVRVLESFGYTVHQARDGREALQKVRELGAALDLLLADTVMPAMGGPELAGEVRRLLPDVPILMMSGYSGDALSRSPSVASELPFLHKPFSRESLSRAVRAAMEKRPAT